MSAPRRTLAGAIAGWWRQAALRAELASLDDRTLRDIGLDRSEWSSVLAESAGRAEPTRRHVQPPVGLLPAQA